MRNAQVSMMNCPNSLDSGFSSHSLRKNDIPTFSKAGIALAIKNTGIVQNPPK